MTISELMAAEDAGWGELHGLMDSLSSEEAERPGYYPEGWSAKDVLAHVGGWLGEGSWLPGGVLHLLVRVGACVEVVAVGQADPGTGRGDLRHAVLPGLLGLAAGHQEVPPPEHERPRLPAAPGPQQEPPGLAQR